MSLRTSGFEHVDATDSIESYDSLHSDMIKNRAEPKPLDRFERDLAQTVIDREHPLKKIPIWVALPFLRCCKRGGDQADQAWYEKVYGKGKRSIS